MKKFFCFCGVFFAVLLVSIEAQSQARESIPSGMVRIEGGTFTMGSPRPEAGRDNDEAQHEVTLSSFYMGKYEVTLQEYTAVMEFNPNMDFQGANLPVINVSWYDAVEFCNAKSIKEGLNPVYTIDYNHSDPDNKSNAKDDDLRFRVTWDKSANGYRLPTEAEWEYACRAGKQTAFYTGAAITQKSANYKDDSRRPKWVEIANPKYGIPDPPVSPNTPQIVPAPVPRRPEPPTITQERPPENIATTLPVGQYAPNALGLYDMHGNRAEWCWDWYGAYSLQPATDPSGASSGKYRVARGGSWRSKDVHLRSAYRITCTPTYKYSTGIRLVRSAGIAQKTASANLSVNYSRINAERNASHIRWIIDSRVGENGLKNYSDKLTKNNIDMQTFKARLLHEDWTDKYYVISIMENTSGTIGILLENAGISWAWPVYE